MEKSMQIFLISAVIFLNSNRGFSYPTYETLKNNTVGYENQTPSQTNKTEEIQIEDRVSNKGRIFNCGAKVDMATCLKARMILYMYNLSKEENISLIGNMVTLSRASQNLSTEGRSLFSKAVINTKLPEDPRSRNELLDNLIVTGITKFMRNYVLQLRLPEWSPDSVENSLEEARQYTYIGGGGKKKKKGGGMVVMMPQHDDKHYQMMLLMMKAMMIKMAMAAIAAVAGKALLMSVVSFVISSIIGLKNLSHNHGETKVEIVKYPVHSSHGYGGQSYDRRTLDDDYGQHLAYKGQNWAQ